MKKTHQKIIVALFSFLMIFPFAGTVNATTPATPPPKPDYTVLTPLPGTTKNCTGTGATQKCTTDLENYLPGVFKLTMGVAAALAFIMITFGGATYAVSDSITGKNDGKRWIENALWGLLLVIGAYTILYTINPQILNLKLNIPRPEIKAGVPTVTPGVPMNPTQVAEDQAVRNSLISGSIQTKPACLQGQTTGCVNLNGLPPTAVNGLKNLSSDGCRCNLFITGGTEGGHRTHGAGAPVVDLRPNGTLNRYISDSTNAPEDGYTRVKTLPNGQRATFTYETAGGNANGTSTGAHWHVVIN